MVLLFFKLYFLQHQTTDHDFPMVRMIYIFYIKILKSMFSSCMTCQCNTLAKIFTTNSTLIGWFLRFVMLLQILWIMTKFILNITKRPGLSMHIKLSCCGQSLRSEVFIISLFRFSWMFKSIVNLFSWAILSF